MKHKTLPPINEWYCQRCAQVQLASEPGYRTIIGGVSLRICKECASSETIENLEKGATKDKKFCYSVDYDVSVCPECDGRLVRDSDTKTLICLGCGATFTMTS